MFEHFIYWCYCVGRLIQQFHGFEDLIMAIEYVNLFIVTANRELEGHGRCVLIILERDIYSMLKFPGEVFVLYFFRYHQIKS